MQRKKGAGKEKRGNKEDKRGGKGGKKGRQQEVEEPEAAEEGATAEEEVLTVLDTLWPKKEGLTLVKWCVDAWVFTIASRS